MNKGQIRIALAQINPTLGDLAANADLISKYALMKATHHGMKRETQALNICQKQHVIKPCLNQRYSHPPARIMANVATVTVVMLAVPVATPIACIVAVDEGAN